MADEMSQFLLLKAEFPDIYSAAAQAEAQANSDPRASAVHARIALETMVDWLFRRENSLKTPYQTNLAALLAEPSFQALVGQTLSIKARFVKDIGNAAAHGKPVSRCRRRSRCANSSISPIGSRAPTPKAPSRRRKRRSTSRTCRA